MKCYESKWTKTHPNGVVTHGSTEPVLTVLDVQGFELKDLFLIGVNDRCGSLVFPSEARAWDAAAVLEPMFSTQVDRFGSSPGHWAVKYDRREPDGSIGSHFITDMKLKDGTQVIRDGRWVK